MYYELAAVGAALCWAMSSLLAANATREIGGLAFARLRIYFSCIMLLIISIPTGLLASIPLNAYLPLALSGIIGLVVGDGALFLTLKRLGPRRTQVLYTSNAPFAVLLGILLLGEQPTLHDVLGILVVIIGVVLAVVWGKRPSQLHAWESVDGPLLIGVFIGLLSGLGQALGSVIVKPVLDSGVDPIGASAVRMLIASVLMLSLTRMMPKPEVSITKKHLYMSALNSLFGIVLGATLLLYAFSVGDVGMASVLSSVTPILVLPLIWMNTGERPAAMAWLGAVIAVGGIALITIG